MLKHSKERPPQLVRWSAHGGSFMRLRYISCITRHFSTATVCGGLVWNTTNCSHFTVTVWLKVVYTKAVVGKEHHWKCMYSKWSTLNAPMRSQTLAFCVRLWFSRLNIWWWASYSTILKYRSMARDLLIKLLQLDYSPRDALGSSI